MKIEVTTAIAMEWFKNWDRDYYTWDGMTAILDYYDEINPDMNFDVIAICCECTEYGDGAAMSLEHLFSDYGDYYPVSEYIEDNGIELENGGEIDRDEYAEHLANELDSYTTVLRADNGNYIVFEF